jgi:hypothetical protein
MEEAKKAEPSKEDRIISLLEDIKKNTSKK